MITAIHMLCAVNAPMIRVWHDGHRFIPYLQQSDDRRMAAKQQVHAVSVTPNARYSPKKTSYDKTPWEPFFLVLDF